MLLENTIRGKLNNQQSMNASWLVTTIKAIMKLPIQKSEKPIFLFRITNEAAVRNRKILAVFKVDLDAVIEAQKDSPLNYILEFRNILSLAKLFLHHEDKTNIINIIQKGSCYRLNPIREETRKSDLDTMILRGNHKSSHSSINSAALDKSISKEIDH